MSCRFENSIGNSWRESCALQSNIPTNRALKYYYLIYQFIMLLSVCWNHKMLLGLVGITAGDFSIPVGTEKRTNELSGTPVNNSNTNFQCVIDFLARLLGCCAVGAENDTHPRQRNKNEN
jgi:hypothetical protein